MRCFGSTEITPSGRKSDRHKTAKLYAVIHAATWRTISKPRNTITLETKWTVRPPGRITSAPGPVHLRQLTSPAGTSWSERCQTRPYVAAIKSSWKLRASTTALMA